MPVLFIHLREATRPNKRVLASSNEIRTAVGIPWIQDSELDWRIESARMGAIYKNAIINIAATGSSDGNGGLFHKRETADFQSLPVFLSWDMPRINLAHYKDSHYYLVDHEFFERDVLQSPLNRRGWVLQERLLSPRILHFSKTQVYWECCESILCENFPNGLKMKWLFSEAYTFKEIPLHTISLASQSQNDLAPRSSNGRGTVTGLFPLILEGKHGPRYLTGKYSQPVQAMAEKWAQLVEEYSKAQLTYSTDKLVAIAGVASTIQLWTKDEYLAGLWRSSLLYGLMWCTKQSRKTSRPPYHRAPTWSWAFA